MILNHDVLYLLACIRLHVAQHRCEDYCVDVQVCSCLSCKSVLFRERQSVVVLPCGYESRLLSFCIVLLDDRHHAINMPGGSFSSFRSSTRPSTILHASRALLVTLLFISPVWSIWPFSPKRFTKNALMEAGSMGLDDGDRIIAFGDFNGDQL